MAKRYFHYTVETRLEDIINSEKIKLATASVYAKKEKAVAWVSSNENWEPTATKMVADNFGNPKKLTFEEQVEHFGCARIEVEAKGLAKWSKLRHAAKMDSKMANTMENTGIKQGGRPSEWFGSLYPITINRWIRAEVYKDGEWVEYAIFE
jgi:hypothetical protein